MSKCSAMHNIDTYYIEAINFNIFCYMASISLSGSNISNLLIVNNPKSLPETKLLNDIIIYSISNKVYIFKKVINHYNI